jgi:hypothetical protein
MLEQFCPNWRRELDKQQNRYAVGSQERRYELYARRPYIKFLVAWMHIDVSTE